VSFTAGPDGALWFAEASGNRIGRITTDGTVTEIPIPTSGSNPLAITTGPDGNIWFTEYQTGGIGRVNLAPVGGPVTSTDCNGGGSPSDTSGTCQGQPCAADPVNCATGDLSEAFTDISIPGRGLPLSFARTYNSLSAGTNGPLGFGWSSALGASLTTDHTTGNVTLHEEIGTSTTFTLSNGVYTAPPRVVATLVQNPGGGFTLTRDTQTVLIFNAEGRLVSERDLNGNVTTFHYDSGGHLAKITDAARRALTLTWTGGHITRVTDPRGRKVSFGYDGNGNLTSSVDVNRGRTKFGYAKGHLLTSVRDARGFVTQNSYDGHGRVISQLLDPKTKNHLLGLNRLTKFEYGGDNFAATGGTTKITDPVGHVTVRSFSYGQQTLVTYGFNTAHAATWSYTYDPATLGVTSITDPNGHTSTMAYDALGNLLSKTDALGRTTTYTYNSLNERTSVTDPKTVTTSLTYDIKGNLRTLSTPLVGTGQTSLTFHYHTPKHPGDVTSMTDPKGKIWRYAYDAYGDRTSLADPLGDKATYRFNKIGWLLSQTSPKGNAKGQSPKAYTTIFDHNAFGDVTTVTDPLGHKTTRTYDPNRNLVQFVDGVGHVNKYIYDAANELTTVKRADGTSLRTDYNPDGTVLDQVDGSGNKTSYGYDPLGRVGSVTDPLNRTTSYTYDGAGNRLTLTDPQGQVTSYAYDVAGEPTSISYSNDAAQNVSNIRYDPDGQRTAITDATGTSTRTYDSLHRLMSSTDGAGGIVGYGYDLNGNLTSLTYPGSVTIRRTYDAANRLRRVADWLGNATTFGYDRNSNLTSESFPGKVSDTFTMNRADQLSSILDVRGGASRATLFSAAYSRDANGQLTSDSSVPSQQGSYRYTPLNQLCYAGSSSGAACSSPPANAFPYNFNAADNLTRTENPDHTGAVTQSFNVGNELCWTVAGVVTKACNTPPEGATTYGYDTRGNLTSAVTPANRGTCYTYDQGNRLSVIRGGTGSSCLTPTLVAAYTYDGTGLRMSKSVGGKTTQFAWNLSGGVPTLLQETTSGHVTRYINGPGGLAVEQIDPFGAPYFYHHDQLGSARLLTSPTGIVRATYTYDPYGNLVRSTGAVSSPLRYAGQYWDSESGLYYLRARYYEPATGQFLSRDSEVSHTRSAYGYVGGNPLNATDVTGQDQDPCATYAENYLCESTLTYCRTIDTADSCRNVLQNVVDEVNRVDAWFQQSLIDCQHATTLAQKEAIGQRQQLYLRADGELRIIYSVITGVALPNLGYHWKSQGWKDACLITELVGGAGASVLISLPASVVGSAAATTGEAFVAGSAVTGGGGALGIAEIENHGPCSGDVGGP
jgi:RHS repeat-associated protein